VHVAYIVIDAVIDVPRQRERFKNKPDEFFVKPRRDCRGGLSPDAAGPQRLVP
jgi:hypothetical protein